MSQRKEVERGVCGGVELEEDPKREKTEHGGVYEGRRSNYSRMIDSYTKNMTAALGMTRIICALRPPYSDAAPSSAMTNRSV